MKSYFDVDFYGASISIAINKGYRETSCLDLAKT